MKIAIIPARGGSKRIPRKNIKNFLGQPMIGYAINQAKLSGMFDRVIVTTDDNQIASIARDFGAETPFVRPPELSDDLTPTVPVIAHAIKALEKLGSPPDFACCIYPCVPFLQVDDLVHAFEVLQSSGAGYCYPIAEFPTVIQRALRKAPSSDLVEPINPQYEWTRTQDLEASYYDAGQFYWGTKKAWVNGLGLQSHGSGVIIPQWRVADIDTEEDWIRAELLCQSFRDLQHI